MLAWLARIASSTWGRKILYWLGSKLWKAAFGWIQKWWRDLRLSRVNKENVEKYNDLVQGPVQQEIESNGAPTKPSEFSETPTQQDQEVIDAGQDLLNRRRR